VLKTQIYVIHLAQL